MKKSPVIIAGTISAVLAASLWGGLFGVWRDKLDDLLFTTKPASTEIVIVAIDEASLQSIGQWPWPRAVFGRAINSLSSADMIGIDVNFKEKSGRGDADDDYLASALHDSNGKVVLSSEIGSDGGLILPLEKFAANSSHGPTNVIVSPDGVVRRVRFEQNGYPGFSWRIAMMRFIDSLGLPMRSAEPVRINYRGAGGTFTVLSFKDVLENKIPGDFSKDKIVLIGVTAVDLHDYHQTPFGIMSGIELQANAVQTIIDGAIFWSSDVVDILAVILLAILVTILAFRIKSFAKLGLSVIAVLAGYNLIVFLSFDKFFILDLFYPNLAVVLSVVVSVTFQYITTHKEKKFIQDSFSRYLAPQVVNELIKNPSRLRLGGERRNMTTLFSDIRGFTTISEKMSPEQLTKFINRYFTVMTQIVFDHGGVIDKYIGDAVMAFWGAPLNDDKHALHGILTALGMMAGLREFNRESERLGEPIIDIGIGVNSGYVTVGNMGSERRFNYTVLGDNVNLASRLEGLNKTYATNVIVSQATIGMLREEDIKKYSIVVRELGEVQVKGKEVTTKIYEIKSSVR